MKMMENFNNFKYNKFNPSVNEWLNSIYSFNKNNLNTLLSNKIVTDIMDSYFNIKPYKSSFEKEDKDSPLKRIFVSVPEVKSSLNYNNIFIYVFNKERIIFNKKITKLQKIHYNNKLSNWTLSNDFSNFYNVKFSDNKLSNFNIFIPIKIYINTFIKSFNSKVNMEIIKILHTKLYTELFNERIKDKISNFILYKRNMKDNLVKDNKNIYNFDEKLTEIHEIMKIKYYILFFYKRYITKIYFNRLKFNYINLFSLSKIFYKIYNKRTNINIINLKYLHLDNSLFINAIVRKLKRRKSKILKVLRKALILPKIPEIDSMFLLRKKDVIQDIMCDFINFDKYINIKDIYNTIFKSLKNTHVIGMRIEGKGRLTKRFTASRATYKKSYKGSLKNMYSSSKGLSAVMSRGFRSNLNFVNLNSHYRNGSYGIKGWHSTI
jgi:hypothetical protein